MPLPAFLLPTLGSFIVGGGLKSIFGGGANRGSVPNIPAANPLNDSAIRASMISQGLATPTGNMPGSNVPMVQTNQPSLANLLTGGTPVPGSAMATRSPTGMSGDAAMAQTANFFQSQLARQLGAETAMINREFGSAGRFTSGQRTGAIKEAGARAGRGFSDYLSSTALERFLQEQRLQAQMEIAQAQLQGQAGQGRTQLFGDILQSGATIFGQNPEWIKSLWSKGAGLFDGGGGA